MVDNDTIDQDNEDVGAGTGASSRRKPTRANTLRFIDEIQKSPEASLTNEEKQALKQLADSIAEGESDELSDDEYDKFIAAAAPIIQRINAPRQARDNQAGAPPAGGGEAAAPSGEQSNEARLLAYHKQKDAEQKQRDAQAAAANAAKKEEERNKAAYPLRAGLVAGTGAVLGIVVANLFSITSAGITGFTFISGGAPAFLVGAAVLGAGIFSIGFYAVMALLNPSNMLARLLGLGKKNNKSNSNNGPSRQRQPGLQPKTPNPNNGLKADSEEPGADAGNGQNLKGEEPGAGDGLDDTSSESNNGEDKLADGEPEKEPAAGQSRESPFGAFNNSALLGMPAMADVGAHLSAEEAEKAYQARVVSVYDTMNGLVDEHGKYVETTAVARGKTQVKIQVGNGKLSPEHVEERLKGIAINASIEADKARLSVAEAIERFKQMGEDKEGLTADQNAAQREYHDYVCSAVLSAQRPSFDLGYYENMIGIAEPSADQRLYLKALKERIDGHKLDGSMPSRPELAESLGKPAEPVGTELNAGGRRDGYRYANGYSAEALSAFAEGGPVNFTTGGMPRIKPSSM
jgi:hypothetical protein